MDFVTAMIVLFLSIACAVISVFQLREKGFPFNNAYIYATRQEREKMDKTPHYRQSGIVFAFLAAIFLCIAVECIWKTDWLWWVEGALTVAVLAYAVISSVNQHTKR